MHKGGIAMRDLMIRAALALFVAASMFATVGCRHTASGLSDDADSNVEWVKDRF
jgi:hypothetical protein